MEKTKGFPINQKATTWRRGCDNSGPNCVEVARIADSVIVRDSKDPDGPVLTFTGDEWTAFLHGAKSGRFDDL